MQFKLNRNKIQLVNQFPHCTPVSTAHLKKWRYKYFTRKWKFARKAIVKNACVLTARASANSYAGLAGVQKPFVFCCLVLRSDWNLRDLISISGPRVTLPDPHLVVVSRHYLNITFIKRPGKTPILGGNSFFVGLFSRVASRLVFFVRTPFLPLICFHHSLFPFFVCQDSIVCTKSHDRIPSAFSPQYFSPNNCLFLLFHFFWIKIVQSKNQARPKYKGLLS